MPLPKFTIRQLLEAGVHFGHNPRRWNPMMRPYIFGVRHNVHIIDLQQTAPMLLRGLAVLREVAAQGGRILFVGTKPQASEIIAAAAKACGAYYVNHRWLGGMLTNWKTVSQSIKRMADMEKRLETAAELGLTKKETLKLDREYQKLNRVLGGIREMGGQPDLLFVLDVERDTIAVKEAAVLGVPVVGIVDTNADPESVTFPIPGNDDATRAINLYCDLAVAAALDGLKAHMHAAGIDVGMQQSPKRQLDAAQDEDLLKLMEEPRKEPSATTSKGRGKKETVLTSVVVEAGDASEVAVSKDIESDVPGPENEDALERANQA